MSKLCIISSGALRHSVMMSVYTEYFEERKIDFDLIYMDKYHQSEPNNAKNIYRYEYDGKSIKGKICGYLYFPKYVNEILKRNMYSFIIVWGELTASLLFYTLSTKYKYKYCVNIRDLFIKRRKILNLLLFMAIHKAAFVTVSSPKYLRYLPRNYRNYIFFHSINSKIEMHCEKNKEGIERNDKIRILFIGNIRFYNHLFRFISSISNDDRYLLYIVGSASGPVQEYIESHLIRNVIVRGAFLSNETEEILSNADVIYNLYGIEDINLRTALSNKLYYAISLAIPILVYRETYMYEVASSCDIGFAVDFNKNFADDFYNWFQKIDQKTVNEKCKSYLDTAKETHVNLHSKLDSILSSLSNI